MSTYAKQIKRKYSPMAGRTEPSLAANVKARVKRTTAKFHDDSLKEGTKKQKKQFEKLTKQDKREWREALQRAVSSVKSNTNAKALAGYKMSRNQRFKVARRSKLEETLFYLLGQDRDVDFEGFGVGVAAAATTVAAGAVAYTALKGNALIENIDSVATPLMDSIKDFVSKMQEYGHLIWKPALIGLATWLIVKYAHVTVLVAGILSMIALYIPEISDQLKKFVPKGLHFQSGAVSLTADVLLMICTCWIPGKDFKTVTGEFMRRASNFTRASDGIEAFIKKVLELSESFINFLFKRTEDERINLTGKKNAYDLWKKDVLAMLVKMAENPTLPIEEIREGKRLQILGFGFHEVLQTVESKRDLTYWLEKLSLALAPHEGAIKAENNMRAMPACIMIGGPSGTGKSTLLRFVASTILMLSGECTPRNALENLWQKGTTEYWNGYIGQKCLVLDDCFQVKGKPGDMDSEAMQLIRAIGNWSYPLNFADLLNKGKIYLDSPLIIGTTNCKNVHAEWAPFITEPTALTRRFQTAVWISINPEYATSEGRFDFPKVNQAFADAIQQASERVAWIKTRGLKPLTVSEILDMLPWDIWNLHHHAFDSSTISDQLVPGGLRAIVESVARDIQERKASNRKEVKDIEQLLTLIGDAKDDIVLEAGLTHIAHEIEEFPVCEVGESDAFFTFHEKLGTNAERVQQHYAAMAAEEQHENCIVALRDFVLNWFGDMKKHSLVSNLIGFIAIGAGLGAIVCGLFLLIMKIIQGLVGAVSFIIQKVASMLGLKATEVEFESNERVVKSVNAKHMDIATFNFVGDLKMEVGIPPDEAVHDHVYCSTLKCTTPESNVGQFIGLGADVYMFPKHFIKAMEDLDDTTILTFISARDGAKGTMTIRDFLNLHMIQVPGYDVAAVSFGGSFLKATRNILKYFLTQHEVKNMLRGGNTAVRLDIAQVRKDGTLKQQTMSSPTCHYHGSARDAATRTDIRGLVRYNAPTTSGDCGAPLSISENRHYGGRCLIGFHSAGRDNTHGREGYSTVITQELARNLYDQLASWDDNAEDKIFQMCDQPIGSERVELQDALNKEGITSGSFELIGVLREPVNIPTKTALKKSQMQVDEVFGPSPTAPAELRAVVRDGKKIEPMAEGLSAYQTPLEYKDPAELEPVVKLAMQKHWDATKDHPRDVLTFEEAVVPPEGWKLKAINRKTSAGYKYQKFVSPKFPGKTIFFGAGDEYEFDEDNVRLQILRADVNGIIAAAKDYTRELHICTDFLKDELRPLHKVESVSTRVISGTELDYTIAVRMYFGAFLAAMFDTHVENGMAPGINHYKEWHKLQEHLDQIGKDVFDGDFSRFDASEQPWVHMSILAYVQDWYKFNNKNWTPHDDLVREILWLDLVHSRHITGVGNTLNYLVQWNKSLPSGHPLTTMVNSMYSLITLTGCYVRSTGDCTDMWKHASLCTFGDDNISSVDEEVRDKFNQVTVAENMKEMFGLTYTPGNKGGVLVPYTSIENVTFLKRSFLRDDIASSRLTGSDINVGWVGPLAKESWLYEPYWYKNTRTPVSDMESRIEHCLCEMSLHPQSVWDEHYGKLAEWCARNNVPLKLTSRRATREHVLTRFEVWF